MRKTILFCLIIFAVSSYAAKLKLRKIESYYVPFAAFNSKYRPHNPDSMSLILSFYLSDLKRGRYPVCLQYDITANNDDALISSKTGENNFLMRVPILKFARKDRTQENFDTSFAISFSKKMRYKTKKLTITGNMQLVTGEIKLFRIKLKDIKKHLNDLNGAGIKMSFDEKENIPRIILKVDMGKINHYYVGFDDTLKPVGHIDLFRDSVNKFYRIPKSLFKDDDIQLNIIYATDLKAEDIKVNFNVPLKWKSITFPENKVKLVPVKTEDKTP